MSLIMMRLRYRFIICGLKGTVRTASGISKINANLYYLISEGVEDQRRHTVLSNITKWMTESRARITRDPLDRDEWSRLVRCAAQTADDHY